MKNNLQQGLSTIVTIIITVIITAILVGGGMYFFQMNNESKIVTKDVPVASPTPPELTLNDVEPTAAAENKTNGTIEGTFIYPSEGIPRTMRACAENIANTQIICSGTLKESGLPNTFSFEVPTGKYHVYAESGVKGQEDYRAYYTEFVTCGLLASCPSHEKIVVEVALDKTVSDIKPHDWYNVTPTP